MDEQREYRVGELAELAGIPVRTLRYYQERGLLQPPRRAGRTAWYSAAHLARLRLIGDLVARGYRLDGIEELLTAAEKGRGLAEILGFGSVATVDWAHSDPVELTAAELRARFGEQLTPEVLAEAIELGYLRRRGEHYSHPSARLLEATLTLVAVGIPLRAVLAMSWEIEAAFDRMAFSFVHAFRSHVLDRMLDDPTPENLERLIGAVGELRPVARTVADEQFGRAMRRRIRSEITEMTQLIAEAAGTESR
ncbi:MerR family transcriptional regulator [Nocardia jiangsuensis]|uniref:MerR family transcriptional regulator n=1 Tax=Nocardia jiangsuensis TaxID=1691563 RepID=A0ABV8DZ68_9NOCA